MEPKTKLAEQLNGKDFIFTAEYMPTAAADPVIIESVAGLFGAGIAAVNVADNHYGVAASSLAVSVVLGQRGIETVYQLVTRDRNRIALQSDLLGAALLGVRNVLCLSGYHQSLIGNPQAANVFDIDSIQLIALVKKMGSGRLLDGGEIGGAFAMLAGAAANPHMKPLDLNLLRLGKKVAAGADFIQTQAVFDVATFRQWLEEARKTGLTEKAAFLAGVMPLPSAARAEELAGKYTDMVIPPDVIDRMKAAGDAAAQKKEGVKIAVEIIKQVKGLPGLRGIYILSGGNETVVPELMAAVL